MFITGPFANTKVPCSGRTSVVTKSPLTGLWADSDVGGKFGEYFKKTGYDGIVIKGKAAKPCYMVVMDTGIKIKEAMHLWGKDTYETHDYLAGEMSSQISTMSIGLAGEKQIPLASIVSDGRDARMAGRCGVGAVMGPKWQI